MAGKFELTKTKRGQFMFNLKASNGRIILTSEQYSEKAAAKAGIASVKRSAAKDSNYDRKATKKGEPFFSLKASNGEVIGTSEVYSSNSAMENGIESVKTNAAAAAIADLTE